MVAFEKKNGCPDAEVKLKRPLQQSETASLFETLCAHDPATQDSVWDFSFQSK